MARLNPNLEKILHSYEINPREAVWDCHGTLVILHKYCEVIAAKADIRFDPPIPLEANGANKSVALCVVGRMGERAEWSTGEASPANNKNAYPYAMAEKRAKDRVILKLVGLAQYVHSEDEADDFKEGRKPVEASESNDRSDDWEILFNDLLKGALKQETVGHVNEYLKLNNADINRLPKEWFDAFKDRVSKHRGNLSQKPAA